jgi:phenylpyruvate tautomerase PptA (4-oxalocrotonate tautomerase family)
MHYSQREAEAGSPSRSVTVAPSNNVIVLMPANDRFLIITEHEPVNFIFATSYLGVDHTEDLVIIQITFNEGRTTAQKQSLFNAIAEGIHVATGLRAGDVFINLVEVKRENWSFGNGLAQYVLA